MSNASEILTTLVSHESQIVTYRRLSRELKVHVNAAKRLLSEFYDAHKTACQAIFLVTGIRRDSSSGNELQVHLVPDSELIAAQKALENMSFHVYSVGPRVEVTKEAMVIANILAGNICDIADHGAVGSSVTKLADAEINAVPKPAPKLDTQAEEKPAVSKEAEPTPAKTKETKSGTKKSFFGRSANTKPAPKVSTAEPSRPQSDTEAKAESKPRVEDMFMDDEKFSPPVKEEESSASEAMGIQTDEDSQAMSMQIDGDSQAKEESDVEMADATTNDSQNDQMDVSQTSSGPRRVRKRRKVSKIKRSKNSRGMLVSQVVDEWESYSETESDSDTKPKHTHEPAAPSKQLTDKKPTGKGKATPQRNILSFFGKR